MLVWEILTATRVEMRKEYAMKKLLSCCLGVVLFALASASYAYPTLFGPTGEAALPTGDLAQGINVAADYYNTPFNSTYPIRATVGAGKWEIGGLYAANSGANVWGANAKLGFSALGLPGFAVGALYTHGDSSPSADNFTAYVLDTHNFGNLGIGTGGLRGTLGLDWTHLDFNGSDDGCRVFLSGDYTFASRLTVGAELQTKLDRLGESDALSSIFVRYPLAHVLGVQAGFTNASPLGLYGTDSHRFFLGLDYGFGKGATTGGY
jgi:hypothetical protein